MIPFLELFGGNFQDAVTLMELLTTTVKLLGACDGTAVVGKTLLSINLSQTLKALTDKGFFFFNSYHARNGQDYKFLVFLIMTSQIMVKLR